MVVTIEKKIIRKTFRGLNPSNREPAFIHVETIWAKNNLELVRLAFDDEGHSMALPAQEASSLPDTLERIFSEAQAVKNDDITIEWALSTGEDTILHVAAEKAEDEDLTFLFWQPSPNRPTIRISEENFKSLSDFLASIIPSSQEPLLIPEDTPSDAVVPQEMEKNDHQGRVSQLQGRIAELKAQFYRDIEMIAKELEAENSESEILDDQQAFNDTVENEIVNENAISSTVAVTETDSEPAPDEWIQSLTSLLGEEEEGDNDQPESSDMPEELLDKDITNVEASTADKSDTQSQDNTERTQNNCQLDASPPSASGQQLTESKNMFVTESLLEKELEEFFGGLGNRKRENKEKEK